MPHDAFIVYYEPKKKYIGNYDSIASLIEDAKNVPASHIDQCSVAVLGGSFSLAQLQLELPVQQAAPVEPVKQEQAPPAQGGSDPLDKELWQLAGELFKLLPAGAGLHPKYGKTVRRVKDLLQRGRKKGKL